VSDAALAFDDLAARLKPECERIVAQYEYPRSALLPLMHLFQQHEGYVSRDAMRFAAGMLGVTPAVVESTVSFYTLFYRRPVGKYMLQVCRGLSCSLGNAGDIMAYFREKLGIGHLQTTPDGVFSYEEVECLAACDRAACMQVNLEFVYDLTPAMVDEMLASMRAGTYAVAPMVQTQAPPPTWSVRPDGEVSTGRKAPGATGVQSPDNAGGVGDAAGLIMLDRIVNRDVAFYEGTRERAVRDSRAVAEVVASEGDRAGH